MNWESWRRRAEVEKEKSFEEAVFVNLAKENEAGLRIETVVIYPTSLHRDKNKNKNKNKTKQLVGGCAFGLVENRLICLKPNRNFVLNQKMCFDS